MPAAAEHDRLDAAELSLIEMLSSSFGYDYRDADVDWLKDKIRERVEAEQLRTAGGLREKVLHDQACRQRVLRSLASGEGRLFEGPAFFRAFQEGVIPLLRTYPFIRIWHAGCWTGEDVYSMAMLLEEAGIYGRCRIYGTELDDISLRRAKVGVFPAGAVDASAADYIQAGGQADLGAYFTFAHDRATVRSELMHNLVFGQHNLETDGVFNEFHAIVCRGLLPSLDPRTRTRAERLFAGSLVRFGFLCTGSDSVPTDPGGSVEYELSDPRGGIFRRIH